MDKQGNVLSWASDIDPNTMEQAQRSARLPFVVGPVALMPDAHWGMGATIGSVIPTRGAVVPAAVGVDIGCGMIAAELPFTSEALRDDLTGCTATSPRSSPPASAGVTTTRRRSAPTTRARPGT